MPGWSGGGVFQAGGVAYIGLMDTPFGEETGFINTPPDFVTIKTSIL